jgi:hypothetical protein
MSENHYSIGDDKEKKIKKSFDASKIITLLIGLISIILFFRFIIYLSKGWYPAPLYRLVKYRQVPPKNKKDRDKLNLLGFIISTVSWFIAVRPFFPIGKPINPVPSSGDEALKRKYHLNVLKNFIMQKHTLSRLVGTARVRYNRKRWEHNVEADIGIEPAAGDRGIKKRRKNFIQPEPWRPGNGPVLSGKKPQLRVPGL